MKAFFYKWTSSDVRSIWLGLVGYYASGVGGTLHLHARYVLPWLGQISAVIVK